MYLEDMHKIVDKYINICHRKITVKLADLILSKALKSSKVMVM